MLEPPRCFGDLVDDPGWMPSLLLLWIGLVGAPLALTAFEVVEDLPLIAAIGWVVVTFIAGSALSGPGRWLVFGTLGATIAIAGGWLVAWLTEGSYPIAGVPLFGDWNDTTWWVFGGLFFIGTAGSICIQPPTPFARTARLGIVSLLAILTLLVPAWWLPFSNNAQYVLFATAGLGGVAIGDALSVRVEGRAGKRTMANAATTLLILVGALFAAGVFWRLWNGSFTPMPFAEVTTELAMNATLVAVLFATALISVIAAKRSRSAEVRPPVLADQRTARDQSGS